MKLLDYWDETPSDDDIELRLLRLDANETAIVPFTSDMISAKVHYCEEPEIRGYVHCNGQECILCRAGKTTDERALLPVYLPATQGIGILPVSPSRRPGALRPQLLPILRSRKRVALIISRPDRVMYRVATIDLREDMDDGARVIAAFKQRWDAGEVDLASVYPRFDNRDLAAVPGIAAMLQLKGVRLDDHDQQ